MKIKASRKKLWLTTAGVLSGLALISGIAVSCKNTNQKTAPELQKSDRKYDFGIAIPAINSFNYLKFTSLRSISPTLVGGFFKQAPSTNSKIGNLLGLPKLYAKQFDGTIDGLNFDQITTSDLENTFTANNVSSQFYDLSSFGIAPEALASFISDDYQSFITFNNKNQKTVAVKLGLNNGASKWSDGKELTAQDFIDSYQYIMDLNTGSQLRTALLNINIKGSQRMNDVQEAYIRKHGVPYKNPFGRPPYIFDQITKEWKEDPNFVPFQNQMFDENHNPLDTKEVNDIKAAALDIGLSTGQMFWNITNEDFKNALSLPENQSLDLNNLQYIYVKPNNDQNAEPVKFKLQKNPYFVRRQIFNVDDLDFEKKEKDLTVDQIKARRFKQVRDLANQDELLRYFALPRSRFELLMEFETFAPKPNSISVVNDLNGKQELLPANRKFIETHGGIHNFGTNLDNFVYSSAFNIDSTILGPEGFITLSKNKNYYGADQTIPNNIKIYFNSKNEVKSLWFEQGIISATDMPTSYMLKFWSQEHTRKLMSKSQGFGTVAIQFNLNKDSRYDSYEDYVAHKDDFIPLLDPDLRRAISFATNRQNILLLTGWTSSFPVSNWTAFGVIKNSKGDNLELWFDDVKFKSEFKDKNGQLKEYYMQNDTFMTHSAKNYKFENIDRLDKGFDPEMGRNYLNRFVQNHPEYKDKEIHLTFLYSTEPAENAKAAIAFKDIVERSLSNAQTKVVIDLKALPPSTYVSYLNSGKFDLTYNNLDKFGKSEYSIPMGAFFLKDGVNWETRKTQGFELNPSGGWTFKDFFETYQDDASLQSTLDRLGIPRAEADIIRELAYASDLKTQDVFVPQWYINAFARLQSIFKVLTKAADSLTPIRLTKELIATKQKSLSADQKTHAQMAIKPTATDYQTWHDYLFNLGRYANSLQASLIQINAYHEQEKDLFTSVAGMYDQPKDKADPTTSLVELIQQTLKDLEAQNTGLELFIQNDGNTPIEQMQAKADEILASWTKIFDLINDFNTKFISVLEQKLVHDKQVLHAAALDLLATTKQDFTYLEEDFALSKLLNTQAEIINANEFDLNKTASHFAQLKAFIDKIELSTLKTNAALKMQTLSLINVFKLLNHVNDLNDFFVNQTEQAVNFTYVHKMINDFFDFRKDDLHTNLKHLVYAFETVYNSNQQDLISLFKEYATNLQASEHYATHKALIDKLATLSTIEFTDQEKGEIANLFGLENQTFTKLDELKNAFKQFVTLQNNKQVIAGFNDALANLFQDFSATNFAALKPMLEAFLTIATDAEHEMIANALHEFELLVKINDLDKQVVTSATSPDQFVAWTTFNPMVNEINLLVENMVNQKDKNLYKWVMLIYNRINKIKEASLFANKAKDLQKIPPYNIRDYLLESDLFIQNNAFYQTRLNNLKNKINQLLTYTNDQETFFAELLEDQVTLSKEFDISYRRGFNLKNEAFPLFNYVISVVELNNYYKQLRDLNAIDAEIKNLEDQLLSLKDNDIEEKNSLLKKYEELLKHKLPLVRETTEFANQKVYLSKVVADENAHRDLYAEIKDTISQEVYTVALNKITNLDDDNVYNQANLEKYFGKENSALIWNTNKERVPYSFNIIDAKLKPSSYSLVKVFAIDPRDPKKREIMVSSPYKFNADIVDNEIFTIKKEDDGAHRERIKNFFNSNRGGWESEDDIFNIMRDLELIIRDQAGILPIMDTDTQWSIKSLGGVEHLYTYYLQYAYDYKHPPRAGLPTSPEDEGV
ncbi:ABC transporter substrate-binding protein [Ureaplasma miroungigenitalium]|uniref:ABC transporter substrate-binding protein n=1 Tax=Ureaplasma miroungigenitalium TaxID=1042321 RepID=A0ABT3BMS4_9BACT|nr:ABC transporter substrate-binding protein [Ureaplasma miroungigenitalium]MCV3728538.1 ABC transporter substrate-binding protein [Ureaplasma miroungigenitalium]